MIRLVASRRYDVVAWRQLCEGIATDLQLPLRKSRGWEVPHWRVQSCWASPSWSNNNFIMLQATPDLLKGQQELTQQTNEETAKQILYNYLREGWVAFLKEQGHRCF